MRASALALLLVAVAGCTQPSGSGRLPDYALPQAQVVDPAQLANRDGIAYRTLTRGDFRGSRPPLPDADDASHMSAFTCANIVPRGPIQMELRQQRPGGPFVARPGPAAFVARMDRDCSWWNPEKRGESPAYVLQHEQIHFAIAELAARDLTRRVRQLSASGDAPTAAAAALQRQLDQLFRASIDAMTARNTRFDLDTSGRHAPELQQRWFEEVSAELKRKP